MENNKDLEAKFNEEMEKWREHYLSKINLSSFKEFVDCQAFKNLVAMGTKALPLIRKAYDTEPPDLVRERLSYLVRQIIGNDLSIPKEFAGESVKIADYTIKWLDENMDKYLRN